MDLGTGEGLKSDCRAFLKRGDLFVFDAGRRDKTYGIDAFFGFAATDKTHNGLGGFDLIGKLLDGHLFLGFNFYISITATPNRSTND